MEGPILDAQELDAIREAIRIVSRGRQAEKQETPEPSEDCAPLGLIADDSDAERVRPSGIKLAIRWANEARPRLLRALGIRLGVEVGGVEVIEPSALRDALDGAWNRCIDVNGRSGLAVITATGPMIEGLASLMLGGPVDDPAGTRNPSATALRLFGTAGEIVTNALREAWRLEQGRESTLVTDAEKAEQWSRGLSDSDIWVAVTLLIEGRTRGQFRLIARPDVLAAPSFLSDVTPPPREAVEAVLGAVPIEVRVELGRRRMTMDEFSALEPGSLLALDTFVDDLLPVVCAGVRKAFGRAIVARGVMAVEVVDSEPTEEGNNER